MFMCFFYFVLRYIVLFLIIIKERASSKGAKLMYGMFKL